MDEADASPVTIVGRCCESGDVLVRDAALPRCQPGDVIAILSTGAYNSSMASCYNRVPRPAVLLASGGNAEVIVRRETWDDLIGHDVIPERLSAECRAGVRGTE
jgi:diaminopimelate decarboxylase